MKWKFLTCLSLLLSLHISAQKAEWNWNPEDDADETHFAKTLGTYKGSFCTIGHEDTRLNRLVGKDLHLRFYKMATAELEQEIVVKDDQTHQGNNLDFVGANFYRDTILILYLAKSDKEEDNKEIFGFRRVTRDGKITDFKAISTIENLHKSYTWRALYPPYKLQSADSTKLAWVTLFRDKDQDLNTAHCIVLSAKGELLWEGIEKFPQKGEMRFLTGDPQLSNKGEVFIAGKLTYKIGQKPPSQSTPYRTFFLLRFDAKGTTSRHIFNQKKYYYESELRLNEKSGDAIVISTAGNTDGKFNHYALSFTKMDFSENSREITEELPTDFFARQKNDVASFERLRGGISTILPMRDIFIHESGEISILFHEEGEEFRYETSTTTGLTTSTASTYHGYYGILLRLGPTGNFLWKAQVPKRNKLSRSNETIGFVAFAHGEKIYLLYNDHPKNEERLQEGKLLLTLNSFRSRVMLSEVNPNGNVTRHPLYLAKDFKAALFPSKCTPLGGGSVQLYGGWTYKGGLVGCLKIKE